MKCFASHSRTVVRGDIHLMLCCRAHLPVTCVPMVLVLWAWLAVALCSVKAKTTLVFCTIPPGFILVVPRNGQYVYIYIYIYIYSSRAMGVACGGCVLGKPKTKLVFRRTPPKSDLVGPRNGQYVYIQFLCYGRGLRWFCFRPFWLHISCKPENPN
jgi:hypothetical protein